MEIPARMPELLYTPAVFAIKDYYQIMVMARSELLFWVSVGDENYYDHSNGIIRSSTKMHRVNVPMDELNKAGEYTVHYRRIIDRKPYFPTTEDEVTQTFKFRGLPEEEPIKIYQLSDTHNQFTLPSQAATYFGDDIDLFILNGDIPNHSGDIKYFDLIYRLCEAVTGGARPCIFSRGNHDTRGFFAENIAEYTPTENGHSYFSFRLGRVWGIVVDCGEDKWDWHAEYGGTVACNQFRKEETRYIDKIIKNAEKEYNAEGVEYRLCICHVPFCAGDGGDFDPDPEIFTDWCKKFNEHIKPQVMLCGHYHSARIDEVGGALDKKGQPCTIVMATGVIKDEKGKNVSFKGGAYTIDGDKMKVEFTNSAHEVLETNYVDLK